MTIRSTHLSEPQAARRAGPQGDSSARLRHALAGAGGLAVVAMLSLPGARSISDTFGWTPLWLLAWPTVGWLALWLLRDRSDRGPRMPATAGRRMAHRVPARWHPRPASPGPLARRDRAA
ncbi:MAG TPA: hypothetical protein VLK29_08525 [Luteimonas sp.]|nr:hypothetical protein [Luteimonas sp.]